MIWILFNTWGRFKSLNLVSYWSSNILSTYPQHSNSQPDFSWDLYLSGTCNLPGLLHEHRVCANTMFSDLYVLLQSYGFWWSRDWLSLKSSVYLFVAMQPAKNALSLFSWQMENTIYTKKQREKNVISIKVWLVILLWKNNWQIYHKCNNRKVVFQLCNIFIQEIFFSII